MCSWVYCLYPRNPIICQAELILKYPQLFRFFFSYHYLSILAIPFKLQVVPYLRACKFENMTVYIAKWLLNIWYEFINEHDLVGIECQSCSVAIRGTGFCQILCKLLRFKPKSPLFNSTVHVHCTERCSAAKDKNVSLRDPTW